MFPWSQPPDRHRVHTRGPQPVHTSGRYLSLGPLVTSVSGEPDMVSCQLSIIITVCIITDLRLQAPGAGPALASCSMLLTRRLSSGLRLRLSRLTSPVAITPNPALVIPTPAKHREFHVCSHKVSWMSLTILTSFLSAYCVLWAWQLSVFPTGRICPCPGDVSWYHQHRQEGTQDQILTPRHSETVSQNHW